jgi:hypothetical protein
MGRGAVARRNVLLAAGWAAAASFGARAKAAALSAKELPADLNAELALEKSGQQIVADAIRSRGGQPPPRGRRLFQTPAGGAPPPRSPLAAEVVKATAAPPPAPYPSAYEGYPVRWAADAESVDARHLIEAEQAILGGASEGAAFTLTPRLLAQICDNNAFVPMIRSKAPYVLFGLRGASLGQTPDEWLTSATITVARPNHFTPSCLLGVWYRGIERPECFRIHQVSTVTNAAYLLKQATISGDESNLCPTGLQR